MYLSKGNHLCWKQVHLACETWVILWKKYFLHLTCFKEEIAGLTLHGIFSWVEDTYVSLQRNPSMLEAATSSTVCPCENSFSFWKECTLQISIFKVEFGHLVPTTSIQLSWRNTCISQKKTIHVRSTLFSCENCVSFGKEYFLNLRCFKGEIGCVCSK
jgi:hypothetical protein